MENFDNSHIFAVSCFLKRHNGAYILDFTFLGPKLTDERKDFAVFGSKDAMYRALTAANAVPGAREPIDPSSRAYKLVSLEQLATLGIDASPITPSA